jgi:hypothetical protein
MAFKYTNAQKTASAHMILQSGEMIVMGFFRERCDGVSSTQPELDRRRQQHPPQRVYYPQHLQASITSRRYGTSSGWLVDLRRVAIISII